MKDIATIDVPGFPQDVLNAATLVEDEIMAADLTELDTQYVIAKAIMAERTRCASVAAAEVMKFRSKVGGRYYPGYHEDMREAVKNAVCGSRKGDAA